ncbi:MAG: DoxX family protein [Bacteroidetes bacterium]|nr:DoxX family protein [Bacteroidota bacterium]
MKAITNLARLLVGVLFIFSGFIKANDPMGFGYKLEEYFEVFGTLWLVPLAMWMAIAICVVEVALGIMLLLGQAPRTVNRLLLAMILFFTFLTFYSAYFNKVTDCGCFGDAIPLTPWQSFAKDLAVLGLILLLLRGQKHIKPLLPSGMGNKLTAVAALASLAFPVYTYRYLPAIDFRPYKVGTDIAQKMKSIREPVIEIVFVYEKNGQEIEIPMDQLGNYPDLDSYTYIDRRDKVIDPGVPAPIHDFVFLDKQGVDVTDTFLNNPGYKLLTIQYDLERADSDKHPALLALEKELARQQVSTYHLTAGTTDQVATLGGGLGYLQADKTMLKTVIRSNPGLVLFHGTTILAKWPSTRMPQASDILALMGNKAL